MQLEHSDYTAYDPQAQGLTSVLAYLSYPHLSNAPSWLGMDIQYVTLC